MSAGGECGVVGLAGDDVAHGIVEGGGAFGDAVCAEVGVGIGDGQENALDDIEDFRKPVGEVAGDEGCKERSPEDESIEGFGMSVGESEGKGATEGVPDEPDVGVVFTCACHGVFDGMEPARFVLIRTQEDRVNGISLLCEVVGLSAPGEGDVSKTMYKDQCGIGIGGTTGKRFGVGRLDATIDDKQCDCIANIEDVVPDETG